MCLAWLGSELGVFWLVWTCLSLPCSLLWVHTHTVKAPVPEFLTKIIPGNSQVSPWIQSLHNVYEPGNIMLYVTSTQDLSIFKNYMKSWSKLVPQPLTFPEHLQFLHQMGPWSTDSPWPLSSPRCFGLPGARFPLLEPTLAWVGGRAPQAGFRGDWLTQWALLLFTQHHQLGSRVPPSTTTGKSG